MLSDSQVKPAAVAGGWAEPQVAPAHLELRQVSKRYPDGTVAVSDVSFSIRRGEFFGLLGPSGCGKTTTLNMIAGFLQPTSGQLILGGRDIVSVPAHRRGAAMMFQKYALFPHLTVRQNVAFGPRAHRRSKSAINQRVAELLDFVGLGGHGDKYPDELSGGQQQRVALARALAIDPELILLDEPLSNLDARMRLELRAELRTLLHEAGATVLIVTHDQSEAFSLCDRVAVMSHGVIQDVATPEELYSRPRNATLASFIGEGNFLAARVSAAVDDRQVEVVVTIGAEQVRLVVATATPTAPGTTGHVLVRPESLALTAAGADVQGEVVDVSFLGPTASYVLRVGGQSLLASRLGGEANLRVGERCGVDLARSNGVFVPDEGAA